MSGPVGAVLASLRRRRRSRRVRAVFLHLPKTAGQSVRRLLAPHRHVLSNTKQDWLGWQGSYTHELWARRGYACVMREQLGPELWDAAFTFTFVRNPWARAVSAWRYLDRPGDLAHGLSFPAFLARIQDLRPRYAPDDRARNKFSWHVEPQAPQIIAPDGRVLIDFIGRTETLQSDVDAVCERLAIPSASLPRVNTTQHAPYQTYYEDETRRLVGEIYREDVERFGYTFDGSSDSSGRS